MLKLENIIGMEEAKAKLNETIDALKNGQRPEPVLLVVGSWMGKTYLIRKVIDQQNGLKLCTILICVHVVRNVNITGHGN